MSLSGSSAAIFRLCGSLRSGLVISPMSSIVGSKVSKRPRNAFALFWSSKMEDLPKGKESLIAASRLWRSMSESEKEPFMVISRKEMDGFVKPVESQVEIAEKNIRILRKKIRKMSKKRKDLLSGRVLKKKISPYNVYVGELWSQRQSPEAAKKWRIMSQNEKLPYEKKAQALNEDRDSEYVKNPLTKEEEALYMELSEKILQMKKEIMAFEKSIQKD